MRALQLARGRSVLPAADGVAWRGRFIQPVPDTTNSPARSRSSLISRGQPVNIAPQGSVYSLGALYSEHDHVLSEHRRLRRLSLCRSEEPWIRRREWQAGNFRLSDHSCSDRDAGKLTRGAAENVRARGRLPTTRSSLCHCRGGCRSVRVVVTAGSIAQRFWDVGSRRRCGCAPYTHDRLATS